METKLPTLAEVIDSPETYMEELLWIRDKVGKVIPFRLNVVQRKILAIKAKALAAGRRPRFLILKARREGVTTLEQAENFHRAATQYHQQVVTIAHNDRDTEKIFRIANLFYDYLHADLKPKRLSPGNKRDLCFPKMHSVFEIGTAGSRAFARGSTLNKSHCSEVAWWPGKVEDQRQLLAGVTEATSEGEVVLESTPNGIGNLFHEIWTEAREGRGEWTPMFFAWWEDPTNAIELDDAERAALQETLTDEEQALAARQNLSLDQLAWRRAKQAELKGLFAQEYPEDDVSCFLVRGHHFFDLSLVQPLLVECKAPKALEDQGGTAIWELPQADKSYVIGMDTAEGTAHGDFTAIGVLCRETCEQVARFHGRVRPEIGAQIADRLGRKYNNAVLAVEANNHGHSALNSLQNVLKYPHNKLYHHVNYDAYSEGKPKLGWQTNERTRPLMLDGLKSALEQKLIRVNDREFIAETFVFEETSQGRYDARPGFHDDLIIAWGIAWAAWAKPVRSPKVSWV